MINLLPDDYKSEIRAARTNVLLMRYIAILVVAITTLGGLVTGSYFVLNTARDSAQAKVNENQQRVAEYSSIKASADSFRSDLSTVKTILQQDISFSKLVYKIADAVPSNVVLDSLTLDPNTFGTRMTISASAKSFDDAAKLKEAFASKQELFSGVQLQSIQSGGAADSASAGYPVKVSISVILNKGAAQ